MRIPPNIFLFSFIFFLFQFQTFSQQVKTTLEGTLTNESGTTVMGASVILRAEKDDKIITYSISDAQGHFNLLVERPGNYILEISHIAYLIHEQGIEIIKNKTLPELHIVLKEKRASLDEIIIKGRSGVANLKGDTISFNLNAYATGNEQKLGELVEKLPGLEVDENGSILYKGKKIDNLLVDGKPFFGDNHKIATQNLNAEMIGGIDLIENFEKLGSVKTLKNSDETALNIEIKEKYQGKPTGDVAGFAAYKERYKLHGNIYLFTKKYNLSFIADINNLGQLPISVQDFMIMDIYQGFGNRENNKSSLKSYQEIPTFLLEKKNARKRISKFAALNAAFRPSNNFAINVFSIFDKENIFQNYISEKTYFGQNNRFAILENAESEKSVFLNQTKLKAEYKPSNNSIITYSLYYRPKTNEHFNNIKTTLNTEDQLVNEHRKGKGYYLGQEINYAKRISNNSLFSLGAFYNTKVGTKNLFIKSTSNLFLMGNSVTQQLEQKSNNFGVNFEFTTRFKSHIAGLGAGYVVQKTNFEKIKAITENQRNYFFGNLSIQKKEGFFQYEALLNFRKYSLEYLEKEEEMFYFLPSLETKFSFSKTHYIGLSYRRQIGFPIAQQLNTFGYVLDYRNYQNPSDLLYNRSILQDNFGMSYFYFNLFSGTLVFLNSSYKKANNEIGSNSQVLNTFNYSNFTNTNYGSSWTNILKFETRINPIKTTFKIDLNYIELISNHFIENIPNKSTTHIYTVKPALTSYFKERLVNYEVGLEYSVNNTSFSLFSESIKRVKTAPYINLNGNFGSNWTYYLENSLVWFQSGNVKRDFYRLDAKLIYRPNEKTNFEYWISGNDLLNIDSRQIVETNSAGNVFSRSITARLPGYIGFGLSYDF